MIDDHLNSLGNCLNELCKTYENIILLGDFNSEMCEDTMKLFCSSYNLKNLINEPTCFKNMENPSCIDLVFTNKSRSFQQSPVMETGLSDFYNDNPIVNTNFQKQTSKILSYRNYKNFENDYYKNELLKELNKYDIYGMNCYDFENIFMNILNIHVPLRKKYLRANNAPSMNKSLSKAIMVRSSLRNKFLKSKTRETREAYAKQRNYCVTLLRKTKKCFYENLNPKFISNNKTIWNQVTFLF